MNKNIDQFNEFLDSGAREPKIDDERATARVTELLSAAPAPDPSFLSNLERKMMSTSTKYNTLVSLPAAERVNGGAHVWQKRASALSAAALITVVILGGLLASWRLFGEDHGNSGPVPALPAAATSPFSHASATPELVSSLSGAVLYADPSTNGPAMMTFFPGIELELVSKRVIDETIWLQLHVPDTNIVGWGQALPSSVPNHPPYPTPVASPLLSNFDGPSLTPGALATVSGDVSVWTSPNPEMSKVWTAVPSDRLTLTGERIDQYGVTWVHVLNEAKQRDGWIAADFLFAIQRSTSSPTALPNQSKITALGGEMLFKETSTDSEMVTILKPGAEFVVEQTKIVNGVSWTSVVIPQSAIARWIPTKYVDASTSAAQATPEAGPTMTAIVMVNGVPWKGTPNIAAGEPAHVIEAINVWSQPGAGMQVVSRINPSVHVIITGACLDFNGATWAPIQWGDGANTAKGWIIANFLAPDDGSPATPEYHPAVVTAG